MADPFDDLIAANPAPAKAAPTDPFDVLIAANPAPRDRPAAGLPGDGGAAPAEKPAPPPVADAGPGPQTAEDFIFGGQDPPANVAATDRPNARLTGVTGGMVEGIPIAGPILRGGADRVAAGGRSLVTGKTYADELAGIQQRNQQFKDEHPVVDAAAQLAGGVLATGPAIAAAPAAFGASKAPLAARAGASLATNGLIGAADGAVRSGGDVEATIKGGVIGAGAGLAAPILGAAAGRAAEKVVSTVKPAEAVPTVDALKNAARFAYRQADEAGVQIAQPTFTAFVNDLRQSMRTAGIDRTIHPDATAALARLEEVAATSPTLSDVEILRRVARGAANPMKPDESRLSGIMVDKLDDFVGRLKAGDLVSGDAGAAVQALGDGRSLWGRARRAEMIEDAITRATDRAASTGSGGNTENAIRQNLRAILDSPKKRAGFSGEEIQAIRDVVRGGPVQNALRLAGKLSPAGNGLMAALGIGATAANPAMAALPAVGYVAKKAAERGTTRGVERLGTRVRAGGRLPVSPLALPAREAVEPLAINIFDQAHRLADR